MTITISNVYIETFEQNIRFLAQQGVAKLRSHVTEKSTNGEKHNWERIGAMTATEKTSARQATPASDAAWSRRVSIAETWNTGATSEQEDLVQMLVDPNSTQARDIAMAMARAIDDIIIAAATGAAIDGDGSSVAYTAGQTIGDGSASISLDTVLAVQELFYENDVDPDEPKCMVIGPTQQRKLMQLMEVTSKDYQSAAALATGYLPQWMGFTWIVSTRLEVPSAGEINCICFTPRGIGLQINKDITTRVAEDPSLSFAWRIYAFMTMGAVRVEDEHVVLIHLLDSV